MLNDRFGLPLFSPVRLGNFCCPKRERRRLRGAGMTIDLRELRRALIDNWTGLLRDLLGLPSRKSARQWRWNRRGSLSAAIAGTKAGTWFDHEAGCGGGPLELIVRQHGGTWREAADWGRRWLGWPAWHERRSTGAGIRIAAEGEEDAPVLVPANDLDRDPEVERRHAAQRAAQATWETAAPADPYHDYLQRKGVAPRDLRMDRHRGLIIPLVDLDGTIHSFQRIEENGSKRYLAGGAKAGHFAVIGGPLDNASTILVCEGWATGASAHAATSLPVVAAMDAGNLRQVAPILRARFPDRRIVLLADNDNKPGRSDNPGVIAATAAARAIRGLMAVPLEPGDFNDLALAQGLGVARIVIEAAAAPRPQVGTYPRPSLDTPSARQALDGLIGRFMGEVVAYWTSDPLDADFGMAMANVTTAADGADIDADTSDEDDWSVFDLPSMFQPHEVSGWRHGDAGSRGRPC
jgi:putative DNA primase/helicase